MLRVFSIENWNPDWIRRMCRSFSFAMQLFDWTFNHIKNQITKRFFFVFFFNLTMEAPVDTFFDSHIHVPSVLQHCLNLRNFCFQWPGMEGGMMLEIEFQIGRNVKCCCRLFGLIEILPPIKILCATTAHA